MNATGTLSVVAARRVRRSKAFSHSLSSKPLSRTASSRLRLDSASAMASSDDAGWLRSIKCPVTKRRPANHTAARTISRDPGANGAGSYTTNWIKHRKMEISPASREKTTLVHGPDHEPRGIPPYRCYKTLLAWGNRHKLTLCPIKQERTPAKLL